MKDYMFYLLDNNKEIQKIFIDVLFTPGCIIECEFKELASIELNFIKTQFFSILMWWFGSSKSKVSMKPPSFGCELTFSQLQRRLLATKSKFLNIVVQTHFIFVEIF
eukprot:TRINITY_DN3586_c0_g2_i1.p7 TRINITY_DN3586_c0_g2~~TRINITY_DN3586_c0_g2_i1.p7  ORF type:complete len:107 (-),score=0.61 TRINITY_DN3586_c0_g2_i1:575-895(-)